MYYECYLVIIITRYKSFYLRKVHTIVLQFNINYFFFFHLKKVYRVFNHTYFINFNYLLKTTYISIINRCSNKLKKSDD